MEEKTDIRLQDDKSIKIKKVSELKSIIKDAGTGDVDAIQKLLQPFLSEEEKLISCGLTGKFGIFPTYDFYFLTDKRVGDLEITPFTGSINIEAAYLDRIGAYVINQPHIGLLLRVCLLALYCLLIGFIVNPSLKRAYLRFRKSGLFIILAGTLGGTYIFADREKLGILINIANLMTATQRRLDK